MAEACVTSANSKGSSYVAMWYRKIITLPFLPRKGDRLYFEETDELEVDFLTWYAKPEGEHASHASLGRSYSLDLIKPTDCHVIANKETMNTYWKRLYDEMKLAGWEFCNFDTDDDDFEDLFLPDLK